MEGTKIYINKSYTEMRVAGRIEFIRIFFQWSGKNKTGSVRIT